MPGLLIEEVHGPMPYGRALLAECGIGGINCGSGKALSPGCLNVDQLSLTDSRGRASAPGGLLRVTTPDLKKYMDGYADPAERFFKLHNAKLAEMAKNPNPPPRRRAWMVNQIFHYFGHQWIYDFDELVHAASAAGFDPARIAQMEYRTGLREEVSMMDSPLREDETLYVEILT